MMMSISTYVLGRALNVTVHFDSPVIEGSDVEMECRYIYTESDDIQVEWFRQPPQGTMVSRICDYFVTCNSCHTRKFAPVVQDSYTHGHTIKLLNAGEEDEGEYWCSILILQAPLFPDFTSSKLQFDVQSEWFNCNYK